MTRLVIKPATSRSQSGRSTTVRIGTCIYTTYLEVIPIRTHMIHFGVKMIAIIFCILSYLIYPKYSDTSTPYHICSKIQTSTIHYLILCLKIAGWVANSVDPDETPRSAASHLGLNCLLRPVCPNTYGKYGNLDLEVSITHLVQVDSSTIALWTRQFPTAGCLVNFYCYYVL